MIIMVETGMYSTIKSTIKNINIEWDNNPTRGDDFTKEQLRAVQKEINRKISNGENVESLVNYRTLSRSRLN